jgi:hypothetical protein
MFENFKESMRARVAPTGDHISALRQDLRSRLQGFKAQRTTTEQARLEQDFSQVLRAWGIDDAALIPAVLRELRLRILIFALPVALCAVLALFTPWSAAWLPLVLVAPPCILGAVITLWRLSVLTRQQYQPFVRWLCSLVGLSKIGA